MNPMTKGFVWLLGVLMMLSCARAGLTFPAGFKWGASISAYQTEGAWNRDGRGPSIWDSFAHAPGHISDNMTADEAVRFYDMYKLDIELMKKLGLRAFRFSVSWSRVLPTGQISGGVNQVGLQFYSDLVDALLEAEIEPFMCLYHWDLPQALQDQYGGWLSRQVVTDYVEYADLIFKTFAGRVQTFFTFNEPYAFAVQGFGVGSHAPGTGSRHANGDSFKDPYTAAHHMLLAHGYASRLFRNTYRKLYPSTTLSIILSSDYHYPVDNSELNIAAAERAQVWNLAWFADPVLRGQYPKEMLEAAGGNMTAFTVNESIVLTESLFNGMGNKTLGLNHYTSHYTWQPQAGSQHKLRWGGVAHMNAVVSKTYKGARIGPSGASDWITVNPEGFRKVLNWANERYKDQKLSFIVTENGVDCPDSNDVMNDGFRIMYHEQYLNALSQAMEEDGVDVRGYFIWSLLDNFEWANGFSKRFGLVHVDYQSKEFTRTPKRSFYWYRQVILNNAVVAA
eukprot:TRINITY_DN12021_c0_g1_i1.p1 TRINITY_DN12021_c0_g1~~TRINITY_DN12021_c0_g1_i1.p1  ORF type:complete len:507 (-),score=94.57 TRINITY_DN12021_c0_g1_i1:249-1769(-)